MIRTLSKIGFAAIALVGFTASALAACPTKGHAIKLVNLHSDGTVTRSFYVKKDSDSQRTKRAPKYVAVVRDSIMLVEGDELKLDVSPTMVDQTLIARIKLIDQDRDEKGIFSSTFHVVELASGNFGGPTKAVKTAYLAKVVSAYAGNGTYNRGCGEVIKTQLDLESSGDVRR
jgi:hypothetical protein